MNKSKGKKKEIHQEQKLSFGSALKQNFNQNTSTGQKSKKSSVKKINGQKKQNPASLTFSKIDESYNADRAPDTINGKKEFNDYKTDNKGYLQNIPSGDSSVQTTNKNTAEKGKSGSTREILASLEISDGATQKPFRATGLLNKSQLKLASYIKQNKNVTLQGTKRFSDKSGEYYLKNIQLQNRHKNPNSSKQLSLNNPQNLENCFNRDINKIKRKASKIVTLLPENALTPIPKKDAKDIGGIAKNYDKKELNDAQRTAVFIRRMEYATTTKRKFDEDNKMKNQAKKIALIQEWWKTMYKIIKLQKNIKGFLFRKKLMNNLEHQEKLLQFITEFDNIHNYHLYKQFMDNLKKKRDYENSKLMERCEDFNEKLDNLDKLHNYNNFKNCFKKWKDDTKQKKKDDLDNLAKKINDILENKENEDKLNALNNIKDKADNEDKKLNDKIKDFQEKNAKKKFLNDLIKAHRLNKMLNNIKDKLDNKNKKDTFDKLKNDNNISKGCDKLKKLMEDKMKKDALNDMKTIHLVDKLNNLINNHNDKINNNAKKDFIDNLKDFDNKKLLQDKLKKWKDFSDEIKNRNKILNKLKRHKLNELRKKEEQERNKLAISFGVNDFELISDKKDEEKQPNTINQIFISPQNDINILAIPELEFVQHQNFSVIPPKKEQFEFYEPFNKAQRIDKNIIVIQLDDVDSFLKIKIESNNEKMDKFKQTLDNIDKANNKINIKEYFDRWKNAAEEEKKKNLENLINKLNNILTKAKEESDNQLKKDVLDKLNKIDKISKGVEKLDNILNINPKKDALNTLKNNPGNNDSILKKDEIEKLRGNPDKQNILEDLDKLLLDKYRKKFLDNLKIENDLDKTINSMKNAIKTNIGKHLLNKLRENPRHFKKGMQKLDKLFKDKDKKEKDNTDEAKKDEKIDKGANNLEKLLTDKYRKKFLDKLKNNNDIIKASNDLENLINNKLKKDAFDNLKKNNNLQKAIDKLDKFLKDKKNETNKDTLDELKKIDNIGKSANKLEKLINNNLKNKLLADTFKDLKTMDFVDILKNMEKNHDDNNKNEQLKKLVNNLKTIRNKSKKEDNKKLKPNDNNSKSSKRISYRISPKKYRSKSKNKKINNKKLLKDAFNKWKRISSFLPTRNVLQQIKKNKPLIEKIKEKPKDDYYEKYKKKVLQVLSNIYKKQNDSLLREYFNKWRNILKSKEDNKKEEISKYKKKLKAIHNKTENFEKDDSSEETNSFKPKHYIQKQNLYTKRFPLLNNSQSCIDIFSRRNNPNNYRMAEHNLKKPENQVNEPNYFETIKNSKIPNKRRFRPNPINYEPLLKNTEDSNYEDEIPRDKFMSTDNNINNNITDDDISNPDEIENDQISNTSSYYESLVNGGVILVPDIKVTKEPRNYASQSFFINKNEGNDINKNNNNTNQLPMRMKGDFVGLIEQNPILSHKNPRIQVTNSTCDLKQIINNENPDNGNLNDDDLNDEIDKLRNIYVRDKKRILNKVIRNCDKDLYSNQKPTYSQNGQWYSISIPLKNNKTKWKFLNNIKGERDKDNLNKFELIQNEFNLNKKEEPYNNKKQFQPINTDKRTKKNIDTSYKLPEMNFAQFYKSPIRTKKINENEKSKLDKKVVRQPGKRKINNNTNSFLELKNKNNGINNIFGRTRGKIQNDENFKSIEYEDKPRDYNYYDEQN